MKILYNSDVYQMVNHYEIVIMKVCDVVDSLSLNFVGFVLFLWMMRKYTCIP